MTTTNAYMLQSREGGDRYYPSNRRQINRMIELGQAEWAGTDGDEETNTVTHYADRIQP